jgi:hypothetical protein
MAEPYRRDPDPDAPQNPPNSVANRDVRKTALRTYLGPLVVFFVVVGLALLYWATRPAPVDEAALGAEDDAAEVAQGTSGEGIRSSDTPGGHNPQPTPRSTEQEIDNRTGAVVTELGDLLDEKARADTGRRVHVTDVDVDTVDGPTSFWVRDGSARVQVIANEGATEVRPGQQVTIIGTAEPAAGETLRIRASKGTVNR